MSKMDVNNNPENLRRADARVWWLSGFINYCKNLPEYESSRQVNEKNTIPADA